MQPQAKTDGDQERQTQQLPDTPPPPHTYSESKSEPEVMAEIPQVGIPKPGWVPGLGV